MKYIDAEKLIAEIENIRREFYYKGEQNLLHDAEIIRRSAISSCNDFLFLIDSLQQEQPEVDLDAEIAIYLNRNVLNRLNNLDIIEDFTIIEAGELARHFYELGLNARKEE